MRETRLQNSKFYFCSLYLCWCRCEVNIILIRYPFKLKTPRSKTSNTPYDIDLIEISGNSVICSTHSLSNLLALYISPPLLALLSTWSLGLPYLTCCL